MSGENDASPTAPAVAISWRALADDGDASEPLYSLLEDGRVIARFDGSDNSSELYRIDYGGFGEPETVIEAVEEFVARLVRGEHKVRIEPGSRHLASSAADRARPLVDRPADRSHWRPSRAHASAAARARSDDSICVDLRHSFDPPNDARDAPPGGERAPGDKKGA